MVLPDLPRPAAPADVGVNADVAAIARIDAVQRILEVICRTTGLGFSAVARVTDDRWIACAVRDEIAFGLRPGGELALETTLCNEIRGHGQVVVIDHVAEDATYCGHPTPARYGFQSYISVPINLPNGKFFGTLCGIDPKPARLNTPETIDMFKLFADLIALHLDAQERVAATEAALWNERGAAQLREQFIAVLGHDLRNPLSAITSAIGFLQVVPQSTETMEMLGVMQKSASRMAGLINDVLDFARGRLGGGLALRRSVGTAVEAKITQVVTELRSVWPTRTIHLAVALTRPIDCDAERIAQMLSNLLGNALTHGDPGGVIDVRTATTRDEFELSVSNTGDTIPPLVLQNMFQPFVRGAVRPGQQGLGLGLYIASEIARAHHGELNVVSSDGRTCFTFRMPSSA